VRCPTCGFENPPGLRFCGGCGVSLQTAALPSEERRLVTILFSDVTGSTALGEALDPEDVRALYTRYYAIARDVVAAHGGTVAKFIGDAVMAVFGLPQAHGDDAERSLSAALELRDRVRDDPRLGERLPIRLGVNTGEVVATREPAAGDFILTGDAVNVAARLEQAADSWAILCGERTARAAAGDFEFGPVAEVQVKGKAAPVRALPLLGRGQRTVVGRVPLVGRGHDLAQLELVAKRAFGERRPFLLSLIAPAGTGKTRLLEEFLDRLPASTPDATVAVAQCLPYGQRLTYEPLRPVLQRLAAVQDDTAPEVEREALRAWVRERGIESPDRTADLLAATIGLGEVEAPDRAALFAAWRAAIESAARRAPLVLAFEDLHWSSESLLDLVEYVMQPRGDVPVLMIVLARPELLDRRPAWGGGRRNYVSIALEPLDEDAVAELVGHLLGRRSPEIVARVVARSEGNPFYAGEIVRSILDRLPSLDDPAAVESALATLPDTVQATVLARLDLLEPGERRVLQLGSVFGRAFRSTGLAALEPELAARARDLAERLVEKDLVRPSNGGFTFRHILIREVGYQTLPRAERWRLHAAAARWLEDGARGREDGLAELIAFHYQEAAGLAGAVEAEPSEVERIRAGAVRWLSRAAEVAAGAAASNEAARHLRMAIELAELGDLPDLYERLAHVTSGDASVEAYTTALRLFREADRPPDQQLRVLAGLLTMYTRFQGAVGGRPSEEQLAGLRAEGRKLLAHATDERATAAYLIAEAFLPFWHKGAGIPPTPAEHAEAEASARRGLDLAERLDDARLRSAALDALATGPQTRGDWEGVRELARRRLAFEERLDLSERLDAYSMVAWASNLLGDLSEAERISRVGLALVQPGQAVAWALHLLTWRIYTLALSGRWNEAAAAGERACELWRDSGVMAAFAGRGFIAALDVARARRDGVRADDLLQILREIVRRAPPNSTMTKMGPYLDSDPEGLVEGIPWSLRSHNPDYGERALALCADLGRLPASEIIRSALAFAIECRLRILEGQARRALGLALRDSHELAHARSLFEETGSLPYAARVRCEQALLTGDEPELAAGMRVLEELGDVTQLERMGREHERMRTGA
jgi:class 3 adenylate cyclase